MLDIAIGHQMDVFTHILGSFASVSSTSTIIYPTSTIVDGAGTAVEQNAQVTAPDHVAFTGLLKSGALASITYRGGYSSTPGRKQFLWEIDGEEGSIRLESDSIAGAFIQVRDPKVYLNGEVVTVDNEGGFVGNLKAAWEEFAKGDQGNYATLDDAVRNRRLLAAVDRSAKEGKRISLE